MGLKRKHPGLNGPKWVQMVPCVKCCCFLSNLRTLRQILDCSRSSSSGVESNLRQRRNASARGVFQRRPKPPKTAQCGNFGNCPGHQGIFPTHSGLPVATLFSHSPSPVRREPSTLPIFQRLKPAFLKRLLVHPQP